MKMLTIGVLLLVVLSFQFSQAQPQKILAAWQFAINLNSPIFIPPALGSTSSNCQLTSLLNNQFYYSALNFTFPSAGVREVVALAQEWENYFSIGVYDSSFNSSNPCSSFQFYLDNLIFSAFYTPMTEDVIIDHFGLYNNETYYFVAMFQKDTTTHNEVVLNIVEPTFSGNVTPNQVWNVHPGIIGCVYRNYTSPYSLYTWLQQSSGFYDIYGGAIGSQSAPGFGLFNGELTEIKDACSDFVATPTAKLQSKFVTIERIYLTEGQYYTFAVSGNYWDFAFQITPSRTSYYIHGWTAPYEYNYTDCSPSPSGTMDAIGITYSSPYSYTHVANNYAFTQTFAYAGNNSGTNTTLPETCPVNAPLVARSNQVGLKFSSVPSQLYSFVVTVEELNYNHSIYTLILSGDPVPIQQVNYTTTGTLTSSTTTSSYSTTTSGSNANSTNVLFLLISCFLVGLF